MTWYIKTIHKQVQSKTYAYKAQGAIIPASTTNWQTQFKTVSKTFHKRSKINLRKWTLKSRQWNKINDECPVFIAEHNFVRIGLRVKWLMWMAGKAKRRNEDRCWAAAHLTDGPRCNSAICRYIICTQLQLSSYQRPTQDGIGMRVAQPADRKSISTRENVSVLTDWVPTEWLSSIVHMLKTRGPSSG